MKPTKFTEIVSILEQYPLCAKIVSFFLEHKCAMDTALGIAEWWIQEDWGDTQDALYHLESCGIVIARTYANIQLYSFTTDSELHAKLEEYFYRRGKI